MCMFILWLSMVTLHINPFPQSLQWNLLSESAIWQTLTKGSTAKTVEKDLCAG